MLPKPAPKLPALPLLRSIMFAGKKVKADDLKIVEGIGPKIADLLIKAGIKTWQALSETKPAKIKEILDAVVQASRCTTQAHGPNRLEWLPKVSGMR
ncbi:MAG: DUF4332 domain-containing protein [Saprospiraceae bacterium]